MKSTLLSALLLITFSLQAQAPATAPVALKDEPHHRLIFENDYVRVWTFGILGHDATLLHNHDLPYLGIALGAADYVNAVSGKPETHVTLSDGQVSYSKGGFVHLVRTETDTPFRNFTIELLKPQGAPKNRCVKVIADGPLDCPQASTSPLDAASRPVLETDEILLRLGSISHQMRIAGADAQPARLIAIPDAAKLNVEIAGQSAKKLIGGEIMWLPAGVVTTVVDAGTSDTRFFLLTFKDSVPK